MFTSSSSAYSIETKYKWQLLERFVEVFGDYDSEDEFLGIFNQNLLQIERSDDAVERNFALGIVGKIPHSVVHFLHCVTCLTIAVSLNSFNCF